MHFLVIIIDCGALFFQKPALHLNQQTRQRQNETRTIHHLRTDYDLRSYPGDRCYSSRWDFYNYCAGRYFIRRPNERGPRMIYNEVDTLENEMNGPCEADNTPAQVIFYVESDGAILAYFFNEKADGQGNYLCYAHVGQHSACSPDYVRPLKLATPQQYADLERELIGQGYTLEILNELPVECHRPPTKGEIRFGYGATHYRTFSYLEIGHNRRGEIKKWFKADDGLRYYTR